MVRRNKERRNANISLFIMFVSILAVVLPFILKADMMQWGFASAFAGGTIAIIAFFIFLMFNGRAGVQERMFSGENLLAHWQYTYEFWQQENKEDIESSGIGKIVGFFFGGIFSLIGFVVFAANTRKNGLFLMIMLGIGIFFIIIGFISSVVERKRLVSALPEAIIARDGLFYKNILYTWNSHNVSYLESVTMHPATPNAILFVLRQLSGGTVSITHYHRFFISIPVPPGQEQTAYNIIQYFKLPMSQDLWENIQREAAN